MWKGLIGRGLHGIEAGREGGREGKREREGEGVKGSMQFNSVLAKYG